MPDIELTTAPVETSIADADEIYFNDVSETPDAVNRITWLNAIGAMLASIRTLADPNADRLLFWDDSLGGFTHLTLPSNVVISGTNLRVIERLGFAASDEDSDLTTGTGKVTWRNRGGEFNVTAVFAEVKDAPTGSTLIVDINEEGTSILSTKLSIDAGETDSATATAAAVISDAVIANNAACSIDIDQVGSTNPGKALKVWIEGYYT